MDSSFSMDKARIHYQTREIKGDGYFEGNKANSGGAIMSIKTVEKETSVKIEGNNTFIRNEGKDYGGAIPEFDT